MLSLSTKSPGNRKRSLRHIQVCFCKNKDLQSGLLPPKLRKIKSHSLSCPLKEITLTKRILSRLFRVIVHGEKTVSLFFWSKTNKSFCHVLRQKSTWMLKTKKIKTCPHTYAASNPNINLRCLLGCLFLQPVVSPFRANRGLDQSTCPQKETLAPVCPGRQNKAQSCHNEEAFPAVLDSEQILLQRKYHLRKQFSVCKQENNTSIQLNDTLWMFLYTFFK